MYTHTHTYRDTYHPLFLLSEHFVSPMPMCVCVMLPTIFKQYKHHNHKHFDNNKNITKQLVLSNFSYLKYS